MLNHIGKARCHELQQKRSKDAGSRAQATLMALFFKKKESVHPCIFPPVLLRSATPHSPTHSFPPLTPALQCNPQACTEELQTLPDQLDKGSDSASPLSRLRDIAVHLPDTIPLAISSDCIAALAGDPKEIVAVQQLEEPNEDPYEWLDKMLNGICSEYAKRNGLLPSAIRWGPMGLPGLCNTLQFFVGHGFASEEILETRINNLIEEAKKVVPTVSQPQLLAPSSVLQEKTSPIQHTPLLLQPRTQLQPIFVESDEDSDSPLQEKMHILTGHGRNKRS
ncbi:uncharacterized protein EI90DRAFT_3019287 [Cantharellus anzutake]|uniref:uncharacterized protein n=1 Tax=Cantharellus anzutake TaxID=1750568 RepID=UPI0019073AF0|nr:uncharacterized protein EI90DRAFT_3019287 [Cantharellus anzutake]KAF8324979.1 hypothetical protein EI90DRAFT_3019287 [Cantharellus anzutake]